MSRRVRDAHSASDLPGLWQLDLLKSKDSSSYQGNMDILYGVFVWYAARPHAVIKIKMGRNDKRGVRRSHEV